MRPMNNSKNKLNSKRTLIFHWYPNTHLDMGVSDGGYIITWSLDSGGSKASGYDGGLICVVVHVGNFFAV